MRLPKSPALIKLPSPYLPVAKLSLYTLWVGICIKVIFGTPHYFRCRRPCPYITSSVVACTCDE